MAVTFVLSMTALMFNDIFNGVQLCVSIHSQMSLMERGGVTISPVTGLAWTSNSSTCPKDYSLVGSNDILTYRLVDGFDDVDIP